MVNQQLMRLSAETGIELVATNDIHYTYAEDADSHDILLCLQTGKKITDEDRMRDVYKRQNPGNKTIYRIYDKETGKIRADLICLADETFDESKDMIIFDPIETWKKTKIKGGTYTLRELLVPIFQKGACVYTSPSVMEIRDICTREKDTLWEESKRLVDVYKRQVLCGKPPGSPRHDRGRKRNDHRKQHVPGIWKILCAGTVRAI